MSIGAPWLALSVDWQDSPMFDDATHGERLAWVCLLCHVKSQGRGGRARLRKSAFQATYRLSERAVDGMLSRAQKCGAAELNGEFITLCNWGSYQDIGRVAKARQSASKQKGECAPCTGTGDVSKGGSGRDDIWDKIADVWFAGRVPPDQASRVGKAVTAFLDRGATPDEIDKRIRAYRREWPNVECTCKSLLDHWDRFDGKHERGVARRPAGGVEHPQTPVVLPHQVPIPPEESEAVESKRRNMSAIVREMRLAK